MSYIKRRGGESMGDNRKQVKRLHSQREVIVKGIRLTELIRGTMLKRYLECMRANCKCHKSAEGRHGPYYFLAIRRKDKTKHVYVPQKKVKIVKEWVANYNKAWEVIEAITDINIKLIRLSDKK